MLSLHWPQTLFKEVGLTVEDKGESLSRTERLLSTDNVRSPHPHSLMGFLRSGNWDFIEVSCEASVCIVTVFMK